MHALKFMIQSNPWNWYSCIGRPTGAEGRKLRWGQIFYGCPYKSALCPRVTAVRNLGRGPLAPAPMLTYLLTYLVGARAQVHYCV